MDIVQLLMDAGYMFIAQDADGSWSAFELEPTFTNMNGSWNRNGSATIYISDGKEIGNEAAMYNCYHLEKELGLYLTLDAVIQIKKIHFIPA